MDRWSSSEDHSPDPHALLDVGRSHLLAEVDHKLRKLLHVDDVLRVVRVGVDDLRASRHL